MKHKKMSETTLRVRQEYIRSPLPFSVVLEVEIKEVKEQIMLFSVGCWKMEEIKLSEPLYVDDMVIIA